MLKHLIMIHHNKNKLINIILLLIIPFLFKISYQFVNLEVKLQLFRIKDKKNPP